jgi:hypothetical protein
MNNNSSLIIDYRSVAGNILSWMFGIVVLAMGIVNTFWGNDPQFGVFLIFLSLVYFPPVDSAVRKMLGCRIPVILKIGLAGFIIWAAVGVGELFDKIDMMLKSF